MRTRSLFLTLTAAALTLGACSASEVTAPQRSEQSSLLGLPIGGSPRLIQCPTAESKSTSLPVTTLGGVVSVGGVSISIPAGALLSDAVVSVTVPASPYVEVEIHVEGSDHFLFQLPATVSVSYARCSRFFLLPLSAWHIDTETKKLLERMPSLDNKLTRTVTFTTPHLSSFALSGYAVANSEAEK
jgi:hypothetical protein